MQPTSRLIYTSAAAPGLGEEDLDEICKQSAQNNRAVNITGILLQGGKRFLQVLEGDVIKINDLYFGKIVNDKRHSDCQVLWIEPCEYRLFPNWSMGKLYLDAAPGLGEVSWKMLCEQVAEQSPGVLASKDRVMELIHGFIQHFGDQTDQALQSAWLDALGQHKQET